MNKKKIIFVLLLITIILSIGSFIITLSLNSSKILRSNQINNPTETNNGNVQLVIENPLEAEAKSLK